MNTCGMSCVPVCLPVTVAIVSTGYLEMHLSCSSGWYTITSSNKHEQLSLLLSVHCFQDTPKVPMDDKLKSTHNFSDTHKRTYTMVSSFSSNPMYSVWPLRSSISNGSSLPRTSNSISSGLNRDRAFPPHTW